MNSGVLTFAAGSGRLVVAGTPPVRFNGGTPVKDNGAICIAEVVPQTFVGGLGYTNDGRVCVDYAAPITGRARGGVPLTADGRVAVSAGQTVLRFNRALPIDANGRIALDSQPGQAPPPGTSGFSSGFDTGYG